MDQKFTLLQKILPEIDRFVNEIESDDPQAFAKWLLNWEEGNETYVAEERGEESFDPSAFMRNVEPHAALSFYIARLNRYAKYYVKEAFEGTPLRGADDFAYLASTAYAGSYTKSELIQANVGETSGGMDIIRRLEREGLLETFADPEDKRAVRVRLTEKGRMVFISVLPKLDQAGQIIKGRMQPRELMALNRQLADLDSFHCRIYNEEKQYDLPAITKKYLK